MKLLLLGPPGSGKGTISNFLTQKYNFKHISTGNLFRNVLEAESDLAKKIKNFVYEGKLVPDELTNVLLKEFILSDVKKDVKLIFDGYPRNISQAKFLANICKIDLVILLDIKDQIIIKRISGRRMCPLCGTIYNTNNNILKKNNLCNNDNTILVQRKDDDQETIKNRIKIYSETSEELIKFYQNQNIIYTIDASQDYEIINKEIENLLRNLLNDNN